MDADRCCSCSDEVSEEKLAFRRTMARRVDKVQFDRHPSVTISKIHEQRQEQSTTTQSLHQGTVILDRQPRQHDPRQLYPLHAASSSKPDVAADGSNFWRLAAAERHQQQAQEKNHLHRHQLQPTAISSRGAATKQRYRNSQALVPVTSIQDLSIPGITTSSTVVAANDSLRHTFALSHVVHRRRSVTTLQPSCVAEISLGNKRYRECMDYAHLGCRHFVPCEDLREATLPQNEKVAAMKGGEIKGDSSITKVGGAATNFQTAMDQLKNTKIKKEKKGEVCEDTSGHPRDHSRVDYSSGVKKGKDEGDPRKVKEKDRDSTTMGIGDVWRVPPAQARGGCSSELEMAASQVSQVTTCGVESSDSGNGLDQEQRRQQQDQHSERKNWKRKAMPDARSGDDRRGAGKLESEEDGGDRMDDSNPVEESTPQAALDVLADAAIQAYSSSPAEDCSAKTVELSSSSHDDADEEMEVDELGRTIAKKKAWFVHGETPFVQKRVRRCSRPSKVVAMDLDPESEKQARASQRGRIGQSSRKDEFEYDFGGVAKKSRNGAGEDDRRKSQLANCSNKNKKTKTIEKKKKGAGGLKKRNLSIVAMEAEARNASGNHGVVGDGDDRCQQRIEVPEHQVLGAVVRSTRGRSQNLPLRLQGSVLGTWKKGNKKSIAGSTPKS